MLKATNEKRAPNKIKFIICGPIQNTANKEKISLSRFIYRKCKERKYKGRNDEERKQTWKISAQGNLYNKKYSSYRNRTKCLSNLNNIKI